MASNVLLLGVLYLQESSLISQHVHQQGQSSAKDVQLAGFLTFSTTTEAAKLVLSTNNGPVSTRGARRALLPHLIAHSGAGFAFSQKEDFRRSMSSWLARAADLLARVAMNRLRLACCSRASELAIYGGLTLDAYCGRRRRLYPLPFFTRNRGGQPYGTARSDLHKMEHKTGPRL